MSLGQEEMPNAIGIDKFNHNPLAKHSDAAPEGVETREPSIEDAESNQPGTANPNVDNVQMSIPYRGFFVYVNLSLNENGFSLTCPSFFFPVFMIEHGLIMLAFY